jgi:hypothetical protein
MNIPGKYQRVLTKNTKLVYNSNGEAEKGMLKNLLKNLRAGGESSAYICSTQHKQQPAAVMAATSSSNGSNQQQ